MQTITDETLRTFQSTPPAEARGRRCVKGWIPDGKEVSIHSPRRSEGRRGRRRAHATPFESFNPLPPPKRGETLAHTRAEQSSQTFQSTPPAEARGDIQLVTITRTHIEFQSTPPAEARGDSVIVSDAPLLAEVFQSTPPAEARGDS